MNINENYNIWDICRSGFGYISTIQKQRAVTTARDQLPASEDRNQAIHTMRQAVRMHHALQEIRPVMLEPDEIEVASPASATSVSNLGLDTTGTYTTMQSTEEVNAALTSISTFEPEWSGSTAQATISGEYDGSHGTGTLTFKVDRQGTHGEDDLKIKVFEPDGSFLEDINIDKEDPLDTQYSLSNGIILTLGAGDLLEPDSFSITFTETVGSTVDPDKPFNGTGNDNPNLEFGLSVTDGSFQINDVTIDVNADDTINTVLDRINQSDAGMLGTLVNIIADSINALFDDSALRSSPGAMLAGVRNDIRSAVSATFDAEGPRFNTDFGIHFDFENPNTEVISFSQADQRQLEAALTTPKGRATVHNMFFGSESNGLLNRLHGILTTAESSLEKEVGSTGIFVNTSV